MIKLLEDIMDYYVKTRDKTNIYRRQIIDKCTYIKFGKEYNLYLRKKNVLRPPIYENKNGKNIFNLDYYYFKFESKKQNIKNIKLYNSFKNIFYQNNSLSQLNYFQLFPNDITSFYKIFSYDVTKYQYSDFNFNYDSLIDLFFNLNLIPKAIFIDKLIKIAQNAKYEIDANAYFQNKLIDYYFDNNLIIDSILIKKSNLTIENFYYFLYDSPIYKSTYQQFIFCEDCNLNKIERIRQKIRLKIIKENKDYFYYMY